MRKTLVVLVGTIVAGVLVFSAPAAARQFTFQGDAGESPFIVTMTGKSSVKPKRVTSASLTPIPECAYTGPSTLILPIPQTTGGSGVPIQRNPHGHGDEFRWSADVGGISWDFQGRQDFKHHRRWFGRLFIYYADPPGKDCASDYGLSWSAQLTG